MEPVADKNALKYIGLVTEIGLIIVLCVAGGLLVGVWLDRKLGTIALFTVLLLLLGLGSAFLNIYRILLSSKKDK